MTAKTKNKESLFFAMYGGYIDENGNPVKKTKREYPYSYDPYVYWDSHKKKEKTHTVYSDRMWQWDYAKYNQASTKAFGSAKQILTGITGGQMQELLRAYYDNDKIELLLVVEYCNISNGYPLWRFDYTVPKTEEDDKTPKN